MLTKGCISALYLQRVALDHACVANAMEADRDADKDQWDPVT